MKVVKTYTGTTNGIRTRFIKFEFDTGCTMIRFAGGHEIFQQKNRRVCREGSKQVQQMRDAIANRRAA